MIENNETTFECNLLSMLKLLSDRDLIIFIEVNIFFISLKRFIELNKFLK